MSKIEIDKSKSQKKSIVDCTICKEIAKEVQSQVKSQVSAVMKEARVTVEKEFIRELVIRHNHTMKELEKIVEKHVAADLKNAQKVGALEDKVEKDFADTEEVQNEHRFGVNRKSHDHGGDGVEGDPISY